MLLMVEQGIRGVMHHSIYQYVKAKKKYMKDYDKKGVYPYEYMDDW